MAGKRDAIPQHEIDRVVARIKKGESLEHIYGELKATVEDIWFERNAESLYKLAGVDPARDEHQEDLDDVLEAPEPTGDLSPAAPADEPTPEPMPEAERAVAHEELKHLEAQAKADEPAPEKHGKGKHRK